MIFTHPPPHSNAILKNIGVKTEEIYCSCQTKFSKSSVIKEIIVAYFNHLTIFNQCYYIKISIHHIKNIKLILKV